LKDKRRNGHALGMIMATERSRNQTDEPDRSDKDDTQKANIDDGNHCDDVNHLCEDSKPGVVKYGHGAGRRWKGVAIGAYVVAVDAQEFDLDKVPVRTVPDAVDKSPGFKMMPPFALMSDNIEDLSE
jgi:hypothetical protein